VQAMTRAKRKPGKRSDPDRIERLQEGGRCLFALIVTLLLALLSAAITLFVLRDFFRPLWQ